MGDVGGDAGFAQETLRLNFVFAQVIVQGFVNDRASEVFIEARKQFRRAAFDHRFEVRIFQRTAFPMQREFLVRIRKTKKTLARRGEQCVVVVSQNSLLTPSP